MLDTIHLFSELDFGNNRSLRDRVLYSLTDSPSLITNKNTGQEYFLGNIHNLKVKLTDNSIAIEGSLSKYRWTNNVDTLDYWNMLEAIEFLEEDVGLTLKDAKVRRIDLAANLVMKQTPCSYYPLLAKGGYLKRREDDNGLYYRSNNRTILIYDKVIEHQRSKMQAADLFEGENVLRYEVRMNRNIEVSRRLNVHKATLRDVCDNYRALVNLWGDSFQLIPKDVELEIPEDRFLTEGSRNFVDYLAVQGMKHIGGYRRILNMVHEANAQKLFKYPNQGTNIKQCVKRLIEKEGVSKTLQMIQELQTNIDRVRHKAIKSSYLP